MPGLLRPCSLLHLLEVHRQGGVLSGVPVHSGPVLWVLSNCLSSSAAFYAFWDAHKQAAPSAGRLYQQLQQLVAQAEELVEPNAFGAMLQRSGVQTHPLGFQTGKLAIPHGRLYS